MVYRRSTTFPSVSSRTGLAALFSAATSAAAVAAAAPYAVVGRMSGPDGGWDYASVDSLGRRLFIARDDAISVVDLAGGAISQLAPARGAHAVFAIAGASLLLETDGDTSSVRLLDSHTGAERARIPVAEGPDAAIYDARAHVAYVVSGDAGVVSIIDPAKAALTRTITLAPGLEFAAVDAAGRLFVNNADRNEIETVDPHSGRVGKPIPLPGCVHPSGLAYAWRIDRLIAACGNGVAAVVDPVRRRLVERVDIGRGPDAVMVDEARSLAYIPCGESGVLDVLRLDRSRPITRTARIATERGARTGALDPATGRIYLPTGRYQPLQPGERWPRVVAGSFAVLTVARTAPPPIPASHPPR